MKCAIMQPTYLPWAGYFNLMADVDIFVFLDDAQLQKNSWDARNRILINNKIHWITVPVKHTALNQLLMETQLCEERNWRRKHVSMIQHTYAKHPYGMDVEEIVSFLQNTHASHLADLNIKLISYIAEKLNIVPQLKLSSSMKVSGRRTEKILNILEKQKSKIYISPVGAADYLEEDNFTSQKIIKLEFQNYTPTSYSQHRQERFVPYMSIVDVVANLGWVNTAEYVRN